MSQKIKIVILTSTAGWKKMKYQRNRGFQSRNIEKDDLHVILMSDKRSLDEIKKECSDTPPTHLAYHISVNGPKGIFNLELTDTYLKDCHCKGFHHHNTEGTFYKDIIPLVYEIDKDDESKETINKIKKIIDRHFQAELNIALNLLHDIYSGAPKKYIEDKNEEVIDGFKTEDKQEIKDAYNALVEDSEDWEYDHSQQEKLRTLRDKLLSFAIQ